MKRCMLLIVLAAAATGASAQSQQALELARRYTDALHGFSLRPPADAQRSLDSSSGRLVSWALRDARSGAIAWTISVRQAVETQSNIDLKLYSKALAEKLAEEHKFAAESVAVTSLAGKSAVELSGTTGGSVKFYQRQVWAMVEDGRFLVFVISGPADGRGELDLAFSQVMATVQFVDPVAAKKQAQANLERGAALLAGLKDKDFAAAIVARKQWFIFRAKGKDVGFLAQSESAGRKNDADGYIVTAWVFMEVEKGKPRMLKRALFAKPDGSVERWQEQFQAGDGGQGTESFAEDGFKQGTAIVCLLDKGDKKVDIQKQWLPAQTPYLPRATGMLLPRLVDLSKPGGYAFATYTTPINKFDMRTFTVVGPEKIALDGRQIDAIRATDKPAVDDEEATVWLDGQGRLLRVELADGSTMESAAPEAVLRSFPDAEKLIQATAGWANQP